MWEISAFGINFSRYEGIYKLEKFYKTKLGLIHRRIRYAKSWERGHVKDFDQFEQRLHIYNTFRYNTIYSSGPRRPRYNGV